ncbi:MAG: transposase [Anaerolineae bacterium]
MSAIAVHNRQQLYTNARRLMRTAIADLKEAPDRRTQETLRELTYAVIVKGTTRLNQLAKFLFPWHKAKTAHNVETALSTSLQKAKYEEAELFHAYAGAAYDALPRQVFQTYRGKQIIVFDPTTYEKRTRPGKKGRSMEYPSKLKDVQYDRYPQGYVDVWAGSLLKGRTWLPLARGRFSAQHPEQLSQNQVEEQVLWDAIRCVPPDTKVLAIGDRGLGRKAMFTWLQEHDCDGLFRLRRDINVTFHGRWRNILEVAQEVKSLGQTTWREGSAKPIRGQVKLFQAQLTEDDWAGPPITFVVLLPEGLADPLILGTTLGATTLQTARAIIHLYEYRWVIETSFETLKGAFGLEKFMVRKWKATERLLNVVAMAFMLLLLLLHSTQKNVQRLLAQAIQVLKHLAAYKQLTLGKLREALALDWDEHRETWYALLH